MSAYETCQQICIIKYLSFSSQHKIQILLKVDINLRSFESQQGNRMWRFLKRIYRKNPLLVPCHAAVFMRNMEDLTDKSRNSSTELKKSMSEWEFASSSILQYGLPIDPITENFIRPNVEGAIFSKVMPSPLQKDVMLAAYSEDVLVNILNMDISITDSKDFVEWVAGSNILSSSTPMAHRYGGHQFGAWAMQLGDGRAISLGEYVSLSGKRWDIQLKGSGLTPYSRGGDGRAVIRSSVREFLCSEAMHALGIPTSRAAALVVSSDPVIRDKFYDGKPEIERAAIVMRIAPSWLRFGSLEILARNNELNELRKLVDYAIMLRSDVNQCRNYRVFSFLEQVFKESIMLVAAWQSVGFTHGVLNTDNMSLCGITIDYGPFGFLEAYNPEFIPNTSDSWGRYAYSDQVKILQWNLEKLAVALSPLLTEAELQKVEVILENAPHDLEMQVAIKFNEKLGFRKGSVPQTHLHAILLEIMKETGSDFTMTFRQLGLISIEQLTSPEELEKHWCLKLLSNHEQFPTFVENYTQYVKEQGLMEEERCCNIMATNPQYVLRNWMAQQAIAKAERDDFTDVNFLLEVLSHPFTVNDEAEKRGFSGPTPSSARCVRVSCSS